MSIPEKWAIKNCLEVGEWFNEQTGSKTKAYTKSYHQLHSYLHSHNEHGEKLGEDLVLTFAHTTVRPNFTEITIEQFREHVMEITKNHDYLIPIFKKYNVI